MVSPSDEPAQSDACAFGIDALPLELVHLIVSHLPLSELPSAALTCCTLAALADVRRRRVRGLEQAPFLLSSREIVAADTVCLRDRALSDTAVTAFADACVAGACHTATNVLLSGNEVGDQGCTALAACLGRGALSNVTYLSLFKNRIGDAGATEP